MPRSPVIEIIGSLRSTCADPLNQDGRIRGFAHVRGGMGVVAVALVAALAAGRKAAPKPAADCFVKAIYPDGREEARECYEVIGREKAGTKGMFQSCTQ